jgi:hypothetical protein
VREAVGSHARIVRANLAVTLALGRSLGAAMRDTLITRDELAGLMAGLLRSKEPPTGTRRLGDWLSAHADTVGRRYTSEVRRNWS